MLRQMMMLTGLNCPNCAARLEKAARSLPGVQAATVSFGAGALTVEFDETQETEARLQELIHRMGLGIASVINRPASAAGR